MLFLVQLAFAASSASSFATDAGDWSGGSVSDGVLVLSDESTSLDVGDVSSFTFTARMRLASGNAFTLDLGDDCAFTADYADAHDLRFGIDSQPFGAAELAFDADSSPDVQGSATSESGGVSDPDLVSFNDQWWMLYTATDGSGNSSIHASVSTDLGSWSAADLGLDDASAPAAVVDGGELVVYYAANGSIWRTTTDGSTFETATVALAPGPDFDASGLGNPSVVLGDDGTWRLWYSVPETGGTGLATSADGVTFTREGELSSDGARLGGLDVISGQFGLEGVYTLVDSVGLAEGGSDATFSDSASDLLPVLAMNQAAWSEGGFGSAAVVRNGMDLHLFVDALNDGTRVVGHVASAPEPGTWGSLQVAWDGFTATATWNGATAMTCSLIALDAFTIQADGTAEIDETEVSYEPASTDSADTGDTAPPGDTADSAGDTSDTGGSLDSADTGSAGFNAGEWLGEPGGCGCQSAPTRVPWGAMMMALGWVAFARGSAARANASRGKTARAPTPARAHHGDSRNPR